MNSIRLLLFSIFLLKSFSANCWGFYGHQRINYLSVFLLPPEMLVLYKPNISFLEEHAVDPDKRRYAVVEEAPRHYIDMDAYGIFPFIALPRKWKDAVEKYGEDSLNRHGIVPWHIQIMLNRLTRAFTEKNFSLIMKYSAEIGHYIADAHVPLHTSSNHNGQLTNQKGIHGFWESRIPELLAEKEFDFFVGKAAYLKNPLVYTWERIMESSLAADSVLSFEKKLTQQFPADQKYSFESKGPVVTKQYSAAFTIAYNNSLQNMAERRMRQSIFSVASFWYTAWVNAGQPDLKELSKQQFSVNEKAEFEKLDNEWHNNPKMIGRSEE